jgi:hypothetical protein
MRIGFISSTCLLALLVTGCDRGPGRRPTRTRAGRCRTAGPRWTTRATRPNGPSRTGRIARAGWSSRHEGRSWFCWCPWSSWPQRRSWRNGSIRSDCNARRSGSRRAARFYGCQGRHWPSRAAVIWELFASPRTCLTLEGLPGLMIMAAIAAASGGGHQSSATAGALSTRASSTLSGCCPAVSLYLRIWSAILRAHR